MRTMSTLIVISTCLMMSLVAAPADAHACVKGDLCRGDCYGREVHAHVWTGDFCVSTPLEVALRTVLV